MSNEPTPRTDAFQSSGEAHYMACDFARKLERELAQSQEANAGLMNACDALERELAEVTKQRDALAEALRSIKNELGVPQPEYPAPVANAVKIADEALQSLTPNKL
jgi:predicted  nucleic acid-binding Zn-ribbon protein